MNLSEYQSNVELRDKKLREREECISNIEDAQNSKAIQDKQLEAINNKILEKEALIGLKEDYNKVINYIKKDSLKKYLLRVGIILLGCAAGTLMGSPLIGTLIFAFVTGALASGITLSEYMKQVEEKIELIAKTDVHDLCDEIFDLEKEYDEVKDDYDFTVDEVEIYTRQLEDIDCEIKRLTELLNADVQPEQVQKADISRNLKK